MMGPANRRRAEEFDALLDGGSERRGQEQYADLLAVVAELRTTPEVEARPAFVADLRSQLVAAAERQAAGVVDEETALRLTPKQRRGSNERRLAAALGGFAVVAATGSMAMASQGSLPGDVLYPVKRAIENAQTNLKGDEAARATSLLEHAEARLAEVEALSDRGADTDAATLNETLDDFQRQSGQAAALALDEYAADGDRAAVEELRAFTGRSLEQLTSLSEDLPADSRPALVAAAQSLIQIDQSAAQQCPECGGAPTELPTFALQSLADALDTGTDAGQLTDIPEITAKDLARGEREAQRREREPQTSPGAEDPAVPTSSEAPEVGEQPGPVLPSDLPGKKQGGQGEKSPGLLDGTVRKLTDGLGLTDSDTASEGGEEQTGGLIGTLTDLLGLTSGSD